MGILTRGGWRGVDGICPAANVLGGEGRCVAFGYGVFGDWRIGDE